MEVYFAGVREFVAQLEQQGVNRIPNYIARGLNEIATQAQEGMTRHVQERLTVRGTWIRRGTKYGINLKRATSKDFTAIVSSTAPWLYAQEIESEKASKAGRHLIVPLTTIRPLGRKEPKALPRRLKPSVLGDKAFVLETRVGPILFRRKGRGKKKEMEAMYALEKRVAIPHRIDVEKTGLDIIRAGAAGGLARVIDQALKERG